MRILLQHKIFMGYFLLMAIIGSMVAIVLHERNRMQKIENESITIFQTQHDINTAHRYVTALVTYGESVLVWDNEDTLAYRKRRVQTDSILQVLRVKCEDFIRPAQIDSLRTLLATKEVHLFQIMEASRKQRQTDSLLFNQKPTVITHTTIKNVTRKKKGIAGFFGGKETVQLPVVTTRQTPLDKKLISQINKQQRDIEAHTDSLRLCNKELNRKLRLLITSLDEQTWNVFRSKEEHLKASYERSTVIISGLIIFSIVLLIVFYLIIQQDIKKKVQARKERERLINKLNLSVEQNEALIASRKKAVHTIIHELRTPLTAITGYAGLLHGNDPDKTSRYSGNILQASGHMSAMLNALLEFFWLDNGKEQPKVSPFRLRDVSDMFDAEFRPQAGKKDLRLTVECATDVILMGDKERIVQIGNNLLSNAVKFTRSGWVTSRLSHDNGNLVFVVEDSGSGMSDGEQQRIFNPFERLSNAATQDGFGLGLSIVKRIVGMLDGTIRLESEKGKGSRFTVTIPMPLADAVMEQPEKRQEQHLERSYSVVVLDDNEIVLDMVRDMYASVGVHCDVFSNIGDMMEAMRIRNYDFAIIDMKMPEINGFEVLELMRSSSIGNSKEIPVVVATASGSCEAEELTAHGFTACLFKPFSLPELMEASGKCLSVNADRDGLPDLTSLLAYGDREAMLDRLVTETEKDMQAVRDAGEKGDRKALGEWVHCLRSSWAVIRADKPLWEIYELLHQEQECSETELRRAVSAILEKGNLIVKVANEERRKPDEDICD